MTSPENKGPWRRPDKSWLSKIPLNVALWAALLILGGLGIWWLAGLFPGQLDDRSGQIDLVWSVLILVSVSASLLVSRKINFSKAGRQIFTWFALAILLIQGFSFQEEIRGVAARLKAELIPSHAVVVSEREIILTRGDNGHFRVSGLADNTRVLFLVDTGASDISISREDAKRMGIDISSLSYTVPYRTANGLAFEAPYQLKTLVIGPIELHGVSVSISKSETSGSLLGMSFLNRLSGFEIKGRKMILRR